MYYNSMFANQGVYYGGKILYYSPQKCVEPRARAHLLPPGILYYETHIVYYGENWRALHKQRKRLAPNTVATMGT